MSVDEHRRRYREAFDRFPGPSFAVQAWPGRQYMSGYAGATRHGDVFEVRVTFQVDGGRSAPEGQVISGLAWDGVTPWDRALRLLALTSLMAETGGPIEGDTERRHRERLALLQAQVLEPIAIAIDGELRAAQRVGVPDLPMWLVHAELDGSSVAVIGRNLEVSEVALETILDPTGLLAD